MHNLHMQHGHRVPHLEQRPLVSVKPAAPPLSASRQPRLQARKQADTVVEDVSQEQQQEATGFSAVVQKLLHRAASSLTRGQTTCLTCKGQGTCTCPACSGHGVVDRDARQNVMRHTTQKLRSVLNGERSEYHSDWLTSNRCRRCHGTGVMVCPTCQGLGTRHATNPTKQ
jgi:DnaJ-class molecular chaperone